MSNPFIKKEEEKMPEKIQDNQAAQADKSPTVLLSQTDAYIHERIKAQPKTRQEVDVKVEIAMNPEHHRLSLPSEFDDFMKRYAFRWIYKRERAISEACDNKGWVLVNRTHFPELPNHLFSVTGSIERGDNILGFMKLEKAEKLRLDPGRRSREVVKSRIGAHKGKSDFYVPDDRSEDGEDSEVIGI